MSRTRTLLAVAVLAGLSLAACRHSTGTAAPAKSEECDRGDRVLLDSVPVLAAVPPGAKEVDRYQECDGPEAYAGRFYQTGETADRVVAFYRGQLTGSEWHKPSVDASAALSEDLLCASTKVGDAFAYLELWYPDADSGLLDGRRPGTVFALDLSRRARTAGSAVSIC